MEEALKQLNYSIRITKPTLRIRQNTIIYSLAFLLLFFLTAIGDIEINGPIKAIAKHYDEAFALVLTVYVLYHIKFLAKNKRVLLFLQICLLIIGMVSTVYYHYQGIIISLIDAVLLVSRFLIAYYAAYIFLKIHRKNLSQYVLGIAKMLILFLFILSLHEIFFTPFFATADYRYFMHGLQLMFPHATYMAAAAATLLIYFGYMHRAKRNLFIYMVLSTLLIFFTLRMKAIGFAMVYWFFYFQTFYFKKRHYFLMALLSSGAVLLVAYDALMTNYLADDRFMPRMIMLKDGISLMLSHFPLGTGFATFGSAMAASNYSPLYAKLGYLTYRGMSPDDTSFLTDVFWPTVFAQFGFIGAVIFSLIILILVKTTISIVNKDKSRGFSMLMIVVYYLITSTSESGFFNLTVLLMFLMFGTFEAEQRHWRHKIYEKVSIPVNR